MPPKVALSAAAAAAAARTLGPGTRIGSRKQITNATYLRLVRLSRAKGPTKKKESKRKANKTLIRKSSSSSSRSNRNRIRDFLQL